MKLAFLALCGFMLFVYFEPVLVFPFLGPIRAAFVLAILAAVAAIASGARLPKAPQNWAIGFYIIWVALSAQFAVSAEAVWAALSAQFGASLEAIYIQFPLYFKVVLLYFVTAMVIRSRESLKSFVYYNLALSAIVSITTIMTVRAGIPSLGGGRLDRMVNYFSGIGDNSNEFASFMLAMLPLPAMLVRYERSAVKKAVLIVIALSFLLCIVRTRSRGAFIATVLVLPMMYAHSRRNLGTIVVAALISLYVFTNTQSTYWDRIATAFSAEEDLDEIDTGRVSRLAQTGYAVRLIGLHPVLGVGPGNWVAGKVRDLDVDSNTYAAWLAPHNTYLAVAAEVGIPGLIAFVMAIALSIVSLSRSQKIFKRDPDWLWYKRTAAGLKIGLTGFALAAYFLTEQFNQILFILMALSAALAGQARTLTVPQVTSPTRPDVRTGAPLSVSSPARVSEGRQPLSP